MATRDKVPEMRRNLELDKFEMQRRMDELLETCADSPFSPRIMTLHYHPIGHVIMQLSYKMGHFIPDLRPYGYPHYQRTKIEKLVYDMLKSGIIRPSVSSYSSPIILVKKKTVVGSFVWIIGI